MSAPKSLADMVLEAGLRRVRDGYSPKAALKEVLELAKERFPDRRVSKRDRDAISGRLFKEAYPVEMDELIAGLPPASPPQDPAKVIAAIEEAAMRYEAAGYELSAAIEVADTKKALTESERARMYQRLLERIYTCDRMRGVSS